MGDVSHQGTIRESLELTYRGWGTPLSAQARALPAQGPVYACPQRKPIPLINHQDR